MMKRIRGRNQWYRKGMVNTSWEKKRQVSERKWLGAYVLLGNDRETGEQADRQTEGGEEIYQLN